MLGLTRPGLLRDHLQETIELYDGTKDDEQLTVATQDLAKVIEIQSALLLSAVRPGP